MPVFNDMEVSASQGLQLVVAVDVRNTLNFIQGDILWGDSTGATSIRFMSQGNHINATDQSKVRGFVEVWDQEEFIFPVGDEEHLHPLKFEVLNGPNTIRCSYGKGFTEDPVLTRHRSNFQAVHLESINRHGFWNLECPAMGRVTLYWDSEAHMEHLATRVEDITLVGWNTANQKWEILGPIKRHGDLIKGQVTSGLFIPDEYGSITFGYTSKIKLPIDAGNFLITPNGDGINDFLVFPPGKSSPNNQITIYDRHGVQVFVQENYKGQFNGTSNGNRIWIGAGNILPKGIYYYLLNRNDNGISYQGFLYLER
jgi:gliding motility-associated-like protein